ncbi:helix-turn-helix domain-containing protein [Acidipila sp. EB88]|uniref:helix-turn-helix domain-containing protein n=1 Tax=Acidipila sp. EB88 TaxID=2305226 RepID=UPI000F5F57A1|nr:helix-turn-helix domain-containing protein [Acidipila sp. EB88]RRA48467.1 hypothetical protein D1Y84_09370 [Acidipila sp. EB88]
MLRLERLVLLELAFSCNKSEGYSCYPSYVTVAQFAGLNESTVRLAVAALEKKKLLRSVYRKRSTNRYYLNYKLIMEKGNLAKLILKDARKPKEVIVTPEWEQAEDTGTISVAVKKSRAKRSKQNGDAAPAARHLKPPAEVPKPIEKVTPSSGTEIGISVTEWTPQEKAEVGAHVPVRLPQPSLRPSKVRFKGQFSSVPPVLTEEWWEQQIAKVHDPENMDPVYLPMPSRLVAPVRDYLAHLAPNLVTHPYVKEDGTPELLLALHPCEYASKLLSTDGHTVDFQCLPSSVSKYSHGMVVSALALIPVNPDQPDVKFLMTKAMDRAAFLSTKLPGMLDYLDRNPEPELTEEGEQRAEAWFAEALGAEQVTPESKPEPSETKAAIDSDEYLQQRDEAYNRIIARTYVGSQSGFTPDTWADHWISLYSQTWVTVYDAAYGASPDTSSEAASYRAADKAGQEVHRLAAEQKERLRKAMKSSMTVKVMEPGHSTPPEPISVMVGYHDDEPDPEEW